MSMKNSNNGPKGSSSSSSSSDLLTKKSLALSLAAPRGPPHGSAHHALLTGSNPSRNPWIWSHPRSAYFLHNSKNGNSSSNNQQQEEEAHSYIPNNHSLRQRLAQLLQQCHHYDEPSQIAHPHIPAGLDITEQITRYLSILLPLWVQAWMRDSGILDPLFTQGTIWSLLPEMVLEKRHLAFHHIFLEYQHLTRIRLPIKYGNHDRQTIDVLFPDKYNNNDVSSSSSSSSSPPRGLFFFVHGGAWGSGWAWMYRLIASPLLKMNIAVAVVGYRTYPDGRTVSLQIQDLEIAAAELAKRYPELCGYHGDDGRPENELGVCVSGHSSGAHIAMMMIANRMQQQIQNEQLKAGAKTTQVNNPSVDNKKKPLMRIDSFIGISGVYDISHHFDYESSRGLEEASPMKPVNGSSRENFRKNSPALKILDQYASASADLPKFNIHDYLPKDGMVFVHGMEDDVVPFTSAGEAARVLRSCGYTNCQEAYLAFTGHNETVKQFMVGGRAQDAVVEVVASKMKMKRRQQQQQNSVEKEKSNGVKAKLIVHSRL